MQSLSFAKVISDPPRLPSIRIHPGADTKKGHRLRLFPPPAALDDCKRPTQTGSPTVTPIIIAITSTGRFAEKAGGPTSSASAAESVDLANISTNQEYLTRK